VALVNQLINVAGVRGEDIVLYEVATSRNIGQPIYGRDPGHFEPAIPGGQVPGANDHGLGGRLLPEPDEANPDPVLEGGRASGLPAAAGDRSEVHDQPGDSGGRMGWPPSP
jgi:hypothetical protein